MVCSISITIPALTKKSATEFWTGKNQEREILGRSASLKSCIPRLGLSLLEIWEEIGQRHQRFITGNSDETRQT